MSDFWAQRLGQQQAPAAPHPVPAAPSNRPWWMPGPVQPAPATQPQVTGVVPSADPQQVPAPSSVDPDGKVDIGTLLRQDGYTTTKAQSAKDDESCPDCGGPNYVAEKGKPNSMKHCFDCGYNPRFSQSMAGMSSTGQNIPVKTARMQNITTGMPKMGTVVGHI